MDIKEHFGEVIKVRRELEREYPEGTVYLMSIERKTRKMVGGRVSVVNPHIASVMIVQETHRVATTGEANAWIEEQNRRGARLIALQAKKESKGQPSLGESLGEIVKALQSGQSAPAPTPTSLPAPNVSAPPPAHARHANRPVQPPVAPPATPQTGSEAPPQAA